MITLLVPVANLPKQAKFLSKRDQHEEAYKTNDEQGQDCVHLAPNHVLDGNNQGSLTPRQIEFALEEKALSEVLEVEQQLSEIAKNSLVIQNHYVC
ncbi:hypothetical protein AKJ16_DCAP05957 [Drosera capensis]